MESLAGFRFRMEHEIEERRQLQNLFNSLCKANGSHEIELPLILPLEEYVGSWPRPLTKSHLNRVFHGMIYNEDGATFGAVRYEGTSPVSRYFSQLQMDAPITRYHYFQEMVRMEDAAELDERHQRAFFQLGQEIFCHDYQDQLKELAKTMLLVMEIIESIGQKPKLRLSHIDLVKKIFFNPQLNPIARKNLIPLMEKGELNDLENTLRQGGFKDEMICSFLRMASLRDVPIQEGIDYLIELGLEKAAQEIIACVDDMKLKRKDWVETIRFDAGIHRSLNFYSGITLQLDAGPFKEVAGGGDYSTLVSEMSKKKIYAGGFAAGFERLILAKGPDNYAHAM